MSETSDNMKIIVIDDKSQGSVATHLGVVDYSVITLLQMYRSVSR